MATSAILVPGFYSSLFHPSTGEFLVGGRIFFYAEDKVTPQAMYRSPEALTPYENPYILDSIASQPPWYALEKTYWIKIYDAPSPGCGCTSTEPGPEEVPLYSFFYYPQSNGGGKLALSNVENLFPSYGFDSKIYQDLYKANGEVAKGFPLISGSNNVAVSMGWWVDIDTTDITQKFTYDYVELDNLSLIGNPKNELVLKFSNTSGSGDTKKRLRCMLGYYNALQGQQIAIQARTRLIGGAVSDIPLQLIVQKQGIEQSPQSAGQLPIALSPALEKSTVTVNPVEGAGYSNDDYLFFTFELPLNTDLSLGLTATWSQESTDGTVNPSESNIQLDASKQMLGDAGGQLQYENTESQFFYPLCLTPGYAKFVGNTGQMLKSLTNDNYDYCVKMEDNVELINNVIYQKAMPNRLISFLHDRGGKALLSAHTIYQHTVTSSYIEFTTGLPCIEKTAWNSADCPSLTYTKEITEWQMGFKAELSPQSTSGIEPQLKLTYKTNGVLPTNSIYNPETDSGNNINLYDGGSYNAGGLSAQVAYFFGVFTYVTSDAPDYLFSSVQAVFYPENTIYSVNGDASNPAVFDIFFRNNQVINQFIKGSLPPGMVYAGDSDSYKLANQANAIYKTTEWMLNAGSTAPFNPVLPYFTGYMAWNGIGDSNPPGSYRYILSPNYEGDNSPHTPTLISGGIKTTFDVSTGMSLSQIAKNMADALNNSAIHRFSYNGTLPASGTSINFSSDGTDFILINWNATTTPLKPENPNPSRVATYAKYSSGASASDYLAAIKLAVESISIGVPMPKDFGINPITGVYNYIRM